MVHLLGQDGQPVGQHLTLNIAEFFNHLLLRTRWGMLLLNFCGPVSCSYLLVGPIAG